MKKEVVVEAVGFLSLALILVGAIYFMALDRNEAYMATSDCVNVKWEEYEGQTGTMPSVPLEQMWWRECAEEVREG